MLGAVACISAERRKPMPRTVPTIDGTPNRLEVSVRYIDANGLKRSDTLQIDGDSTDVEIEAIIAALAAASNANIYAVQVSQVYSDVPNSGDALDATRNSAKDNFVLLFKNATINAGRDYFIPAPKEAMFLGGSNIPDTSNALLLAVRDAIDATLVNFEPVTVRFTERRKKNSSRSI